MGAWAGYGRSAQARREEGSAHGLILEKHPSEKEGHQVNELPLHAARTVRLPSYLWRPPPTKLRFGPRQPMNSLREAAIEYAMRGWHVFPLQPGTKQPHGYLV